jgi:hypothetical protein
MAQIHTISEKFETVTGEKGKKKLIDINNYIYYKHEFYEGSQKVKNIVVCINIFSVYCINLAN